MSVNDQKLIKELRCLRMHLAPLMTPDKIALLERVEERLKSPGNVSTIPAASSSKGRQGRRSKKKEVFNKYFYK